MAGPTPSAEIRLLDAGERRDRYGADYILVGPDQHVLWRGDRLPDDPAALADKVRGA